MMNLSKTYKKILAAVLLSGLLLAEDALVFAQGVGHTPSNERGQFEARRKMIMDGNNLRATYHNFTWGGRLDGNATDEITFEFPRNTNRIYIALVAFFVGAEVVNQSENQGADEVFPIVITPNGRTSPQGDSWDINPVPGYYNPAAPGYARSDNPNTWPSAWPDKAEDGGWSGDWNGYFGRGIINADQEFFYRASDNLYSRFRATSPSDENRVFSPDQTDLTRGGLGLIIDARIMSWSQSLISDIHFNIFEITNDGSYNYQKMAFSLWIADLVGGGGSDRPEFDEQQAISYLTHLDRTNAPNEFDGGSVGMAGIQFLETPGNAIDGIDNDGDANRYLPQSDLYNPTNADLSFYLLTNGGGFFDNTNTLIDEVIPEFAAQDFVEKRLEPGDRIILIDDNFNRIIAEYPQGGGTVITQGREINLPAAGLTVIEDTVVRAPLGGGPQRQLNTTLFDENLNGLIDENQPNHLTKSLLVGNQFLERPVRYINYLWEGSTTWTDPEGNDVVFEYAVGDTIQRGLIVPNRWVRERMQRDPQFADLINSYQQALYNVHRDRWPEGYFDNYYRNYHTSAPMIDEARDDFFDNNRAWNAGTDDVGLDGVPFSGTSGEGDGFPTSGHGTPFPGEPNIDKTSVAESDMIGISAVTYPGAGSLGGGPNFAADGPFWRTRMRPGFFGEWSGTDDTDLLVTSSYFPLDRGQTERFSIAVTVAQTNRPSIEDDRQRVNDNLREGFRAYESDYQFATAPPAPTIKVIPGDGQVSLYWDDEAESHFDRFLARLPGSTDVQAANFQGYKVYRSTDPGFQDILTITDSRGNRTFRQPLAVYDLENQWSGLHPVDINGIKFDLGTNSGLQRRFVDTEVRNGRTYYYAVTSFTHGYVGVDDDGNPVEIAPSESPIFISINPDGSVNTGPNVAVVRPAASKAGFLDPNNPVATAVSGTASGTVRVNVIDPDSIQVGSTYRITFEDEVIPSGRPDRPDTLRTKNFTLYNVSSGKTLIDKSPEVFGGDNPVREGFSVMFQNATGLLRINRDLSRWVPTHQDTLHSFSFELRGQPQASDYRIEFGQVGFGQSIERTIEGSTYPAIATNFRIYNLSVLDESGNPTQIEYAFNDFHSNPSPTVADPNVANPGEFSAGRVQQGVIRQTRRDEVFFFENVRGQERVLTWSIFMSPALRDNVVRSVNPRAGDALELFTTKQFSALDVFEFTMSQENAGMVEEESIKEELKNIRVVPNPYVVSNPFEMRGTSAQPDQRRELHFTRLPVPATLRIFTVSGQLVQTIRLSEQNTINGTYIWNLLSKDNLEISYGIYIYHVEVPGIGEHVDKFAVIK